jgi:hypothetical protein
MRSSNRFNVALLPILALTQQEPERQFLQKRIRQLK